MNKAKLVKAIFTQEEIAAINTKNIKLETENEMLKKELGILDCKGWTPELVWHAEFIRCLIEENKKLKHKNELQEKALIKLCLKHHYDSIIIGWEIVIDMENYTVVEKKKPKEGKLF